MPGGCGPAQRRRAGGEPLPPVAGPNLVSLETAFPCIQHAGCSAQSDPSSPRRVDGTPEPRSVRHHRCRHPRPLDRLAPRPASSTPGAPASRRATSWCSTRPASAPARPGIACGVVRNNYFQPAMRELMAHSVSVWETRPRGVQYHPVGYMQISARGDARARRARSTTSSRRSATSRCSSRARPTAGSTCRASSTTGRRRTSPRCCTRSAAATRTTWRRCCGPGRQGDAPRAWRSSPGIRVAGVRPGRPGAVTAVETDRGTIGVRPGRRRRRARGSVTSGGCSTCRTRSTRQGPGRASCTTAADVDLLVAAGGHARASTRTT